MKQKFTYKPVTKELFAEQLIQVKDITKIILENDSNATYFDGVKIKKNDKVFVARLLGDVTLEDFNLPYLVFNEIIMNESHFNLFEYSEVIQHLANPNKIHIIPIIKLKSLSKLPIRKLFEEQINKDLAFTDFVLSQRKSLKYFNNEPIKPNEKVLIALEIDNSSKDTFNQKMRLITLNERHLNQFDYEEAKQTLAFDILPPEYPVISLKPIYDYNIN